PLDPLVRELPPALRAVQDDLGCVCLDASRCLDLRGSSARWYRDWYRLPHTTRRDLRDRSERLTRSDVPPGRPAGTGDQARHARLCAILVSLSAVNCATQSRGSARLVIDPSHRRAELEGPAVGVSRGAGGGRFVARTARSVLRLVQLHAQTML